MTISREYLQHFEQFCFDIWKLHLFDFYFKFEFDRGLNQRESNNSNRGDVASLVRDYCGCLPGVLQLSSTKKNSRPEN